MRTTGTVRKFDDTKGFGFIRPDGSSDAGRDVFVHYTNISGNGRKSLFEGQRVEFAIVQNEKGPAARDVSPI